MRPMLLLLAAVIAVGAGFLALRMSSVAPQSKAAAPQEAATLDVLVAKTALPAGTILTPEMVDHQLIAKTALPEGAIAADGANIMGYVTRADFNEREALSSTKLANPNDSSYISAVLLPGMRAVTIATDAVSGLAGYIFPGDRVDIMLTHNIPAEERNRQLRGPARGGEKPEFVEVLASDVRVLAVNVRPVPGKDVQTVAPSSITLEVDVERAQQLRLAEKIGTLSLALRPLKEEGQGRLVPPTSSIYLTRASVSLPTEADGIRIIRGTGAKDLQIIQSPTESMDLNPDQRAIGAAKN